MAIKKIVQIKENEKNSESDEITLDVESDKNQEIK